MIEENAVIALAVSEYKRGLFNTWAGKWVDLGAIGKAVGLKASHDLLCGSIEAGQDPAAGQRQLPRGRKLRRGTEVVAEALYGKFDGVPELVAPVSVGHHTLNVQVHTLRLLQETPQAIKERHVVHMHVCASNSIFAGPPLSCSLLNKLVMFDTCCVSATTGACKEHGNNRIACLGEEHLRGVG